MKITIIGIYDDKPSFSEQEKKLISACNNFAGGKRHHDLVSLILPENYNWTNITVPLENLFNQMMNQPANWILFASGDPWFYGIANTLSREFTDVQIDVSSRFNSLQLLGHKLGINYGEYKIISLTGRPWHQFDKALILGEPKLAVLTDRKNTPKSIAQRMLEFNYSNYSMYLGEHMGGKKESVRKLSLQEALHVDFKYPNCLFLEKTGTPSPRKLLPENEFVLLENRPNMITKMPVRFATLASMQLQDKSVFWDIGACTGSISIETRLNYPNIKITAFELHPERMTVFSENCRRFQCPGIQQFEGDYLSIDKSNLQQPDAVFLGGYSGKMEEMLDDISQRLLPNGVIAFNSVSDDSRERFLRWSKQNDFAIIFQQKIQVDEHNPIHIITIEKTQTCKQ